MIVTIITDSFSLLCKPSPALLSVAGLGIEEVSSLSPVTISSEALSVRPIMSLLLLNKDINVLKKKMVNSVRIAALRKFGLEVNVWPI